VKEEIRREFCAYSHAFDRGYLPRTTTKKGNAMGNLLEKDMGSAAR
jgi:hypothetical protein